MGGLEGGVMLLPRFRFTLAWYLSSVVVEVFQGDLCLMNGFFGRVLIFFGPSVPGWMFGRDMFEDISVSETRTYNTATLWNTST